MRSGGIAGVAAALAGALAATAAPVDPVDPVAAALLRLDVARAAVAKARVAVEQQAARVDGLANPEDFIRRAGARLKWRRSLDELENAARHARETEIEVMEILAAHPPPHVRALGVWRLPAGGGGSVAGAPVHAARWQDAAAGDPGALARERQILRDLLRETLKRNRDLAGELAEGRLARGELLPRLRILTRTIEEGAAGYRNFKYAAILGPAVVEAVGEVALTAVPAIKAVEALGDATRLARAATAAAQVGPALAAKVGVALASGGGSPRVLEALEERRRKLEGRGPAGPPPDLKAFLARLAERRETLREATRSAERGAAADVATRDAAEFGIGLGVGTVKATAAIVKLNRVTGARITEALVNRGADPVGGLLKEGLAKGAAAGAFVTGIKAVLATYLEGIAAKEELRMYEALAEHTFLSGMIDRSIQEDRPLQEGLNEGRRVARQATARMALLLRPRTLVETARDTVVLEPREGGGVEPVRLRVEVALSHPVGAAPTITVGSDAATLRARRGTFPSRDLVGEVTLTVASAGCVELPVRVRLAPKTKPHDRLDGDPRTPAHRNFGSGRWEGVERAPPRPFHRIDLRNVAEPLRWLEEVGKALKTRIDRLEADLGTPLRARDFLLRSLAGKVAEKNRADYARWGDRLALAWSSGATAPQDQLVLHAGRLREWTRRLRTQACLEPEEKAYLEAGLGRLRELSERAARELREGIPGRVAAYGAALDAYEVAKDAYWEIDLSGARDLDTLAALKAKQAAQGEVVDLADEVVQARRKELDAALEGVAGIFPGTGVFLGPTAYLAARRR